MLCRELVYDFLRRKEKSQYRVTYMLEIMFAELIESSDAAERKFVDDCAVVDVENGSPETAEG